MNETQPGADGTASATPPSIAGYRSGRLLGTGGSAAVWLVTSEQDGRRYAAKVFTSDGDSVTASQLRREMELLERLNHEHLVRLHDVLETGDGVTLLMDYAAGDSLAALVGARGPLPVDEVVTILTPVARCLAYLHSQGVTHSDVAPGNVLFTEHGKPLLADLGLGRMIGEAGFNTAGTAGFASMNESDTLQHGRLRTGDDIHGIAALGWYALTGRVPAASDRRPPLPVVIPGVPEELALIIEAGLDPAVEQRPSATEFEQAVFRSAHAAPVNLVPAVHESVRPHLLTRRNVMDQERRSGKRRLRSILGKVPSLPSKSPRRMDGKRAAAGAPRTRVLAAGGVFAAAILAAGILLSGWGGGQDVLSGSAPASQTASPAPASIERPGPGKAASAEGTEEEGAAGSPPASSPSGMSSTLPNRIQHKLESSDPRRAVQALAWLRSHAFSSGRTELLEQVNVAGSPAMTVDRRMAKRVERTGHVFAGFETKLSDVKRLDAPNDGAQQRTEPDDDARHRRALVAVTASNDDFVEKDSQGEVLRHRQQDQQQLVLDLRHVDGRWLIAEVLAPGTER